MALKTEPVAELKTGYYHAPFAPPRLFSVLAENPKAIIGRTPKNEPIFGHTVDIGVDGKVVVRSCQVTDAPKAGCFTFGKLPEVNEPDEPGEDFGELGKHAPLNR